MWALGLSLLLIFELLCINQSMFITFCILWDSLSHFWTSLNSLDESLCKDKQIKIQYHDVILWKEYIPSTMQIFVNFLELLRRKFIQGLTKMYYHDVIQWKDHIPSAYLCLIVSSLYFSFPLETRPLRISVGPQSAICSNVWKYLLVTKNKVDALLKGLVSASGPHVCKSMIKQMNKSPLFTLIKYLWRWDIYESSFFSANMHVIQMSISTSCIRIVWGYLGLVRRQTPWGTGEP